MANPLPPPRKRRRSANGVVTNASQSSSSEEGATTIAKDEAGATGRTVQVNSNSPHGAAIRRSGGGFLTSRESALVLAGETISLAVTHWLMEECYRDIPTDRAFCALQYASRLLACPGRTNTGLLDNVRRSLRAGVSQGSSASICYSWTRYHNGNGNGNTNVKLNYSTWDPEMDSAEWAAERLVHRRIREAIEYAIVHCDVTIYAPIATVVENIAQTSAERVQLI